MEYTPRLVDPLLERALRVSPAVNVTGPRACGKTTSALRLAESSLQLDPAEPGRLALTALSVYDALRGPEPRLLAEWQLVPGLWDAVRRSVDEERRPGRFLLSGSAWPADGQTSHSGAGRIIDLPMRPMSLFESGESSGEVSLGALLKGTQGEAAGSRVGVTTYADWLVRGGWPGWISASANDATLLVDGYLERLAEHEFPLVGGPRRAPQRFADFIRAYAGLTGHPAPLSTVGKRLKEEGIDVGKDYPGLFHDFGERMYVIEDQPAWAVAPRSRTRLVSNPKRHLVDPSLAAAALGMSSDGLLDDWETFGFLFESLVVRDLRVYAQAHGGQVLHYRTSDGSAEIDAIIEFRDRRWIGIEVKIGLDAALPAADRLAEIASSMPRHPRALAVVVASPADVVQLPSGVWIVPLAALGP